MGATAEAIPLADGSAGAVTAGQAFHWFRARDALAEIHRVLRPGGRLGLVWNRRDVTVDWVAAMDAVLDRYERETPRFKKREWSKAFSPEAPFTALESRSFRHEQEMTSDLLADRVLSISFVAAESGRTYGDADLALAEELARRSAMAVDNARLYTELSGIADTADPLSQRQ